MNTRLFLRHTLVGLIGAVIGLLFWLGRPDWSPEMRFWRAVGDSSFMLLIAALAIGPLARLWPATARLLAWRREIGIWFGLLALGHTILILSGWVQWDVTRLLGYEFIPELGRTARIEPGFGLANLVGLVAMFWALVLTATSSNRAVSVLGASAWKWLQYGAYVVFYLVALHTLYFLFLHYTLSFHRSVPPNPNWFRWPFLLIVFSIPVLQISAFIKTVARKREVEPSSVAQASRRRGGRAARSP